MRGKIVITFTVLLLCPAWSSTWAASKLLTVYLPAILKTTQKALIYKLPDTGQITCYDNFGQIACPPEGEPFYGQDAHYDGPQPAYKANGNSTVTDLNTNLIWQQNTAAANTWHEAVRYCSALPLAGSDNWRLPSKYELQSIVDYSRVNQAGNPIFSSRPSGYWSATPVASTTNRAWAVYFDYGNDFRQEKAKNLFIRCVRD